MVMGNRQKWSILTLGLFLSLIGIKVNALPGEDPADVAAWISAHPTLSPATTGNGLFVKKSNTAAQRFTFQAFPRSSMRDRLGRNQTNMITSERFAFFDMINGVTPERLAETVRTIYGLDIYQDYTNANVIYRYPSAETLDLARRQNLPLLAAQEGELRLGERFAYWMEVTRTDTGIAYNGHVEIMLKEELPPLQARLSER
jgi:hypothetical protein